MFCKASIVADGGVFSPRMGRSVYLLIGRPLGVSRAGSLAGGVGELDLAGLFSGDLLSFSATVGVRGTRSGDFSGDLPCRKKLKSLTFD